MDYYIGQRVVVCSSICLHGKYGTVCDIRNFNCEENPSMGISFDEDINGHDCEGHCEDGHGWYLFANEIEPVDDEPSIPEIDLSALASFLN